MEIIKEENYQLYESFIFFEKKVKNRLILENHGDIVVYNPSYFIEKIKTIIKLSKRGDQLTSILRILEKQKPTEFHSINKEEANIINKAFIEVLNQATPKTKERIKNKFHKLGEVIKIKNQNHLFNPYFLAILKKHNFVFSKEIKDRISKLTSLKIIKKGNKYQFVAIDLEEINNIIEIKEIKFILDKTQKTLNFLTRNSPLKQKTLIAIVESLEKQGIRVRAYQYTSEEFYGEKLFFRSIDGNINYTENHVKKIKQKVLKIYSDGSYIKGNKNVGWAFIALKNEKLIKIESGQNKGDNSYLSEILAISNAIDFLVKENLKSDKIHLYSDHKGLVETLNRTAKPTASKYKDQINSIWEKIQDFTNLKIIWIKGHSGISNHDLVDKLARKRAS